MRLSIWQQFSSNHSGSFGVIGTFQSVDEALKAETELKRIFQNIFDWYQQIGNDWTGEPTPLEQSFAQQYNIEWKEPVDWFWKGQPKGAIDGGVQNFDQFIVIRNPDQTWMTKNLFEQLLKKLGAEIIAGWDLQSIENGENPSWVKIFISCQTADEKTADDLHRILNPRPQSKSRQVAHQGNQLKLELEYSNPQEWRLMITELTRYGCTDIQYKFQKITY